MRTGMLAVLLVLGMTLGASAQDQERIEALEEQVELLTEQVNTMQAGPGAGYDAATIWGYAEMHYNAPENGTTQLDFHRFIFGIEKQINDWITFNSEIEIEHAFVEGGEDSGEVELEQAYLDFRLIPSMSARAGVLLTPVGIVNVKHEPTTFYGVERPDFHSAIVPSTWFDHGAGITGRAGGVGYALYAMSPLDASGFDADSPIRGGRQKANQSETESLAITGMARYTAPGLAMGASFWRGNSISDAVQACAVGGNPDCANADPVDIDDVIVTLYALDFEGQFGPVDLRAEYAQGTIDNNDKLNEMFGGNVPSRFSGYYVEPGFRAYQSGDHTVGIFARYEQIKPQDEVNGGTPDETLNYTYTLAGVNYWPHPDVVLKGDYGTKEPEEGDAADFFNLGIGWVY